jgi:hypothetical protein
VFLESTDVFDCVPGGGCSAIRATLAARNPGGATGSGNGLQRKKRSSGTQEGRETLLEEQVETAEGPINRLNEANGRPLSDQRRRNEEARIGELLRSTGGQRQARQSYQEDERRVGHILALLADAFVYEDQGQENGCRRLGFRPDPAYQARSVEARVFHAMRGTLWINTRLKRLVRLDGEVAENLDFGYGLLGRLNKGGWFRMERRAVSATEWKTVRLEIHMSGRALLVKSFARETSERRGGFQPVSAGLSLAQGAALLDPMAAYSADRKVAERLLRR